MYINKSNTFLDFLVIRLDKQKISCKFFSCVENSPLYDTTDLFWFSSKLEFDFDYNTHRIYFISDLSWNKIAQIMIVNNEINTKSDYYDKITFYWTFFNLYYFNYDIILNNIFWFLWITKNNRLTRFDIKNDVDFIPYFKNEYYNNQNTKKHWNTYFCYSNKTKSSSATYEFRIYDKKLDIIENLYDKKDNNWNYIYKEKYNNNKIIYRIEVQYNSKKIKEKWITLENIFNLDFLHKELENYCFQFLKNTWITKKFYFKNWDTKEKISIQKEKDIIKHTSDMLKIYIDKLHLYDYQLLLKIILKTPWLWTDFGFRDTLIQKKKIFSLFQQNKDLENKNIQLLNENIILQNKIKIFDNLKNI